MEAGGAGRPAAGEVGEPSPFAAYRISSHVSRVTAFPVLAAAATRSLLTLHLLGVHDARSQCTGAARRDGGTH